MLGIWHRDPPVFKWDLSGNPMHQFVWDYFKPNRPQFSDSLMLHKWCIAHVDEFNKWFDKQDEKQVWYAFTLTSNEGDPAKFPALEAKMKQAATKLLEQQTNPVKAGAAYLEKCENGRPHIHGYYHIEGGKRIYAKIFKRHWQQWNEDTKIGDGHIGGYHKKMISESYKDYAAAEEDLVCKIE